jgi:hypothetical protein
MGDILTRWEPMAWTNERVPVACPMGRSTRETGSHSRAPPYAF